MGNFGAYTMTSKVNKNICKWFSKPTVPCQPSEAGGLTHNILSTAVQALSSYIRRKIRDEISKTRRKRRLEKLENRRNDERLHSNLPPVIPLPWDWRPKAPSAPIDIPRRRWKLQNGLENVREMRPVPRQRPRDYC
ncbi:hypothetical protein HF086_004586 [Spodoptera exigua]|uniref:Uncharacterized protein n=1 Tax=Spodoptera exigua TaxID=7107 RepID=A0A922MRG5_SPOEX|nr:hypothetical protein HF086_004586 [Spodoptera exigua]